MKVKCYCCGKSLDRTPSEMKKSKSGRVFCSRSCSAKINNRQSPKRRPEGVCKKCGSPCRSKWHHCPDCSIGRNDPRVYITLEDVVRSHMERKKPDANLYTGIRGRARTKAYSIKDKVCEICGYDKHTQVCHKKAISDFELSASINEEINHIDNLMVLCPNCHWELDNGLLRQ